MERRNVPRRRLPGDRAVVELPPLAPLRSWAAGLYDAALALCAQIQREDTDIVQALETFEGRQRALFDTLSEHVLRRQPALIQTFLRQTAVLGRFSADLCDAVLERQKAKGKRQKDNAGDADLLPSQQVLEKHFYNLFYPCRSTSGQSVRQALAPPG